jgi:hypothetical protein
MKKLIIFCKVLISTISIPVRGLSQSFQGRKTRNTPSECYLESLLLFEPWAESVWNDYPLIPNSGYFGDGFSYGNGGIRGSCSIALSYAVLIRAFPESPLRQHRIERVEAALRYATETHDSGPENVFTIDGKKWGVFPGMEKYDAHAWQNPQWAAYMGFAAALIEKDIDPAIIEDCKRVVAVEADIMVKIPPATGYRRDTKSEENAWDTNITALASAWMPYDPRAQSWIKTAKLYMANTYTVPADSTGPMKEWIQTQTMFPSYTLENHGFFHPSYEISGGMALGDSYLMIRMVNPELFGEFKPFLEFNVIPVWDVTKGILLDTGDLIFPSGMDWSLHQFEDVNYLAWMAAYFGMPEAQWAENRVAKNIVYRQMVNGDGRYVGESCRSGGRRGSTDGFYVEAIQSSCVALSYLHNEIAGFPQAEGSAPVNHVTHYTDACLIIHRSDNALTTVSYGAKTMALVNPLNGTNASQQFLVSPNTSNFIGTDGKTTLADFRKTSAGFRAELILNGIKGRRSRLIIDSNQETVVFIEVPSDTLNKSQDEWLLTSIENHPLSGGYRKIIWAESSDVIREMSGSVRKDIPGGWINIDNWLGLIATTKGNFIYRTASDYNRMGAAEDYVIFQPDEPDKPRAIVVVPGKNASLTSQIHKDMHWKATSHICSLEIIMPDCSKSIIETHSDKKQ